MSFNVKGQHVDPLHHIQNEFYLGNIDINEAIQQQLPFILNSHDHSDHDLKCITPFFAMLEEHMDDISEENLTQLKAFDRLTPTFNATESVLSESGKFRITYETTGVHAVPLADNNLNGVPDYIDELAIAADSSYQLQIIGLGYTDPIPDGEAYNVFVEDIPAYGFLTSAPSTCGGVQPAGTCIFVENDFVGFPSNDDPDGDQLGAIRVTIAHEFKHAIQFVENGLRGDPRNWAEMDATLYEEVTYDNVNDYYNYIEGFSSDLFNVSTASLIPGSYEDVTWALFFNEYYDSFFWPSVWQRISANLSLGFLEALDLELSSRSESFSANVLESYMWHFASGPSFSNNTYGFDEARNYPGPRLNTTITSISENTQSEVNPLVRMSADYYMVDLTSPPNEFLELEYEYSAVGIQYGLIAYFLDNSIETALIEGNPNALSGTYQSTWKWDELRRVGFIVANTEQVSSRSFSFQFGSYTLDDQITVSNNFPNPFRNRTTFEVQTPSELDVEINIYDILGRFVQKPFVGTLSEGINEIEFDGSGLASGVYVAVIETPNRSFTRKILVIK